MPIPASEPCEEPSVGSSDHRPRDLLRYITQSYTRRPHSARLHLLRHSALRFVFFQPFARTCAFSRHNARLPVRARLQSVLGKRNHEFESNPLRQPVWRFCFSVVIRARRSILRPLLRGFRKCRRSLCAPEQQTGAPRDIFLRRGSEWLSFAGQTQPRVRIDCPRAVESKTREYRMDKRRVFV